MGTEIQKAHEAKIKAEVSEISDIVLELNRERVKQEAMRDDLESDLIKKLGEKPSYFSPRLLTDLSSYENPEIRVAVAGNQNATRELLLTMARDKDNEVKTAVSKNPKTPLAVRVSIIDFLSKSADYVDRTEAAASQVASFETLQLLSTDRNQWVRRTVAENPATPPTIIRTMINKEEDEQVKTIAMAALEKITTKTS